MSIIDVPCDGAQIVVRYCPLETLAGLTSTYPGRVGADLCVRPLVARGEHPVCVGVRYAHSNLRLSLKSAGIAIGSVVTNLCSGGWHFWRSP